MKLSHRMLAFAACAALFCTPNYAFAATNTSADGSAPPASSSSAQPSVGSKTGVSPMSTPGTCIYGAYNSGWVSTTLSNGNLDTRFCVNSAGSVTEVHTVYQKTGGSSVTLRNFWEWTNSGGGASTRYYDAGAFTATAGNSYPYAWIYYPGSVGHPSGYGCMRGGIRDTGAGVDFTTRVYCPGA